MRYNVELNEQIGGFDGAMFVNGQRTCGVSEEWTSKRVLKGGFSAEGRDEHVQGGWKTW